MSKNKPGRPKKVDNSRDDSEVIVLENETPGVFDNIKASGSGEPETSFKEPEKQETDPLRDRLVDQYRAQEIQKMTEEPEEKRKLIIKIRRYGISFNDCLKDVLRSYNLETMTYGELQKLLEEIRLIVANRGSSSFVKSLYYGGAQALEFMSPKLMGVNLTGLTENIKQSEDINRTLDEMSIEYSIIDYVPCEQRLALSTVMVINQTFMMNRYVKTESKTIETQLKTDAKLNTIEAYKDI